MRVLRSACKHSTNTRRRHRRLTPRHMPNRQFRYRSTHFRRIEIRFCQAAIDEAAQECPHGHGRHRKVCRISLQPQSCEMDKQEMERERERAREQETRRKRPQHAEASVAKQCTAQDRSELEHMALLPDALSTTTAKRRLRRP